MTTLSTNIKDTITKETYSLVPSSRNSTLAVATPVLLIIACLVVTVLLTTRLISWDLFNIESTRQIQFLPLSLIFLAIIVVILTQSPHRTVNNMIATMKANSFLTGFTLLALPGTVYARFIVKQSTSYFTVAFMMLVFMATYFVLLSVPNKYLSQIRLWILRSFILITVIAATALFNDVIIEGGEPYPGTVILITQALGLVFYFMTGLKRKFLFLVVLILTICTFKNTAIIILLISFLSFYMFPKSFVRKFSASNLIGLAIIGLIVLAAVGGAYLLLRGNYSDGSYDFRSTVYKTQFQHFLESPIIGELFTGETAVLYRAQSLPITVHNDWLDAMAQGGLVGLFLFTGILVSISCRLIRTRNRQIHDDPVNSKFASWQLQFIMAITISFTFNPILGEPYTAIIVWIVVAFAHCYTRE